MSRVEQRSLLCSGGLFGLLVTVLLLPSPVRAQLEVPIGSIISRAKPADIPDSAMPASIRSRVTVAEFGECVARTDPRGAARAVTFFPNEPAEIKAFRQIATSACLRSGLLRMPGPVMRGGLYIGLYRRAFRQAAPSTPPANRIDFAAGAKDPIDQDARQAISLRMFVDCVVREDPTDARAAILAPVASSAEVQAYAALAPHLNHCVTQDQQIRFSKAILSGLLAEVAYRNAIPAS